MLRTILVLLLLMGVSAGARADGLAFARQAQEAEARQDFVQAIALYTQAVESGDLRPEHLGDALHYRGNARFFLRDFQAAADDYVLSLRIDPTNIYVALWLYLAREHAGTDGTAELARVSKKLDLFYWPGAVVAFFLGQATPTDVLQAAKDPFLDEDSQLEQTCEALFYMGQQALLAGQAEKAAELFRQALDTGATDFIEYQAARVELERLGG